VPKKFNDDEQLEIVLAYQEGVLSAPALAEQWDCSPGRIRNILKTHGVDMSKNWERRRTWDRSGLYPLNPTVFDTIGCESAYWLGFLYADGHVTKNGRTVILNTSSKDDDHLAKYNAFLESGYPIKNYVQRRDDKEYHKSFLAITHDHLAQRLTSLGIVKGRTALESALVEIDVKMAPHFIRGIFDGDGCAARSRPELIFCGQYDLMFWVRRTLSDHLGTNPDLKITTHSSGLRYLWYGGRLQAKRISEWMHPDGSTRMDRKFQIIQSY
jgi:hypothetical protein